MSSAEPGTADPSAPFQGVIVLGMHRSGASVAAAILAALGHAFGPPGALATAAGRAREGVFERHDIRAAADALLASVDADWWRITGFDLAAIPRSERAAALRAFRRIVAAFAGRPWAVKEPLLCLLLPLLREAVPRARILHLYRHPLEVARSLRRRFRTPLLAGLALWEAYNSAALEHSRNADRLFVGYGDLLADPKAAVARISAWLAPAGGHSDRQLADAADAVKSELRRERAEDRDLREALTRSQRWLWDILTTGAPVEIPSRSPLSAHALREFESDEAARRQAEARIAELTVENEGLRRERDEARAGAMAAAPAGRREQ
ncbi:MAG: sulfotransferase [Bauldia sp.]